MDFNDFEKPKLTEPGIKYFLNETLKQCHIYKSNYNNILIINITRNQNYILYSAF